MSSSIKEITAAIAAWTPQFDTDNNPEIGVWDIDDALETLEMQTPKRVLMAMESMGDPFTFIALGNTVSIEWTITDRLYIAPVGEMASLRRYQRYLLKYAASYAEAAQADRGLGSNVSQAHVVSMVMTPGVYDYPVGSGQEFFGVNVELTIQEVF